MKTMTKKNREVFMDVRQGPYAKGDWIVHARYGVGQVEGMEKKLLEGERILFYKVKTVNGAYWLSVMRSDVEYNRPIASEYKTRQALTRMRKAPKPLPENHTKRNKAISEAVRDTSLSPKARMIRDLHGKQVESRLNLTEEDALLKLKEQFVNEWSVVANTERTVLEEKLEKALATSAERRMVAEA
jgi:RNA polymerase-interacting CarD/CdnL/TRCF family regulator